MPTPEIDIANRALGHCNQGSMLTSLDQPGKVAATVRLYLDRTRRALLRQYIWKEARHSVILSPASAATLAPAPGWTYAFLLPSDFVSHVRLDAQNGFGPLPPYDSQIDYSYTNGGLMTNTSPVNLEYVRDITDHDPLFEVAFEYSLASALSIPLGNDKENVQRMEALAANAVREAKRAGSIELPEISMYSDRLSIAFAGGSNPRKGPVA